MLRGWSVALMALSRSIWATAYWPTSATLRRTRTMPSEQFVLVWTLWRHADRCRLRRVGHCACALGLPQASSLWAILSVAATPPSVVLWVRHRILPRGYRHWRNRAAL